MNLDGLGEAVSSGEVITQPELLEGYGAGGGAAAAIPAAVVFPFDAQEVSGLVRWASAIGASVMPVSSTGRHSSSGVISPGFVVADLSRMKDVVRADRRNRVALLEPGVTFGELDETLGTVGLRAMAPLAVRRSKSVVAAYLDRTPTLVPRAQWDLSDPLLCIEVVMGTGKVFRTGCSAGPGTLEQQWATGQAQKNPMGPSAFDFFRLVQGSRGSAGIVTWASVKCELKPVVHELLLVPAGNLDPLVESVYRVLRAKWGEECLILDGVALEMITGVTGMPDWVLLLGVAGFDYRPAQRVAYQVTGIGSILRAEGVKPVRSLAGVGAKRMLDAISTVSDPFWKDAYGCHSDVYFLTTLDRAGRFARLVRETCEENGWPRSGAGIYIQPQVGGRVAHFEVTLFYPPDASEKARSLERAIATACASGGAYFSRPSGGWCDLAYRDKPLLVETMRRSKGVFDPGWVLNPDAPFAREVV